MPTNGFLATTFRLPILMIRKIQERRGRNLLPPRVTVAEADEHATNAEFYGTQAELVRTGIRGGC